MDTHFSPHLQALDFTNDIKCLTEDFVGREWIFREIDEWVSRSSEQCFILTGEAGIGKSAIAARLTQVRDDITAYHFCVAGRNSTIVPGTVLRSIAAQLGKNLDGYGDMLAKTIKPTYVRIDVTIKVGTMNGGQITGVVLENLTLADSKQELESLLTAPLSAMPPPASPILILLDSLDEAFTYSDSENLVTLLAGLNNLPRWVRILLTSRPEERVLSYFASIPKHVVAAESQMNCDDLRRYVRNRIGKPALSARLESAQTAITTEAFLSQVAGTGDDNGLADGNFLYTKLLLNDVESGAQPLDDLAALPKSLDEIYQCFLLRLAPKWETTYQPLLAVLVVALEPLSFEQLGHFGDRSAQLTGHHMSDTLLVQALQVLPQFLDVSGKPGEERYRLFHQSLRDYLGDRKRSLGRACPPQDAHGAIADYYLETASSDWNQCDEYGLRHLPVHLKQAGHVKDLDELLINFNWLDAKLQRLSISALVVDYELTDDMRAKLVGDALRRESHILQTDPRSLYVQLRNRLWRGDGSRFDQILDSSSLRPSFPWLRATSRLPIETCLVRTYSGHKETTEAAILVGHDCKIISGSLDGTVRVWELETGRQLQRWETGAEVDSLVASSDGSIVVTRNQDEGIQVWDGNTGTLAYRLTEKGETLGMTADGRGLLISKKKTITLWDVTARQSVRLWKSPSETTTSLLATPDGHYLLAADNEGTIIAWENDWSPGSPLPKKLSRTALPLSRILRSNTHSGRKKEWPDLLDSTTVLAVSEDSRILAAVDMDGFVWLYDLARKQILLDRRANTRGYRAVALSNQSNWLVSGGVGSTVDLWNLKDPQVSIGLHGHTGQIMQLGLTRDGQRVISAGGEGNVCLWELGSDRFSQTVSGHDGKVTAITCSSDGAFALSGGEDRCLRLWDLTLHTLASAIPNAHRGAITSVAFVDADHVVSGGDDGVVSIWDVRTGENLLRRVDHGGADSDIDSLDFFCISADSKRILAAAKDFEQVRIWDLKKQKPLKVIKNGNASKAAAFTADGSSLFLASDELEIIPLAAKKPSLKLSAIHKSQEFDVVRLSRDGKYAVLGDIEGVISIYDLAKPGSCRQLIDHRNYVHTLALSPDGRWLVSGGWDCILRIWDLTSGKVASRYNWQLPLECLDLVSTSAGTFRLVVGDTQGNILFFEI